MRFVAAIFAAALPKRLWPVMEERLPVREAAAASGIVTFLLAMAIGLPAYLSFAQRNAGHAVDLMLAGGTANTGMAQVSWITMFLSPVLFAFFTPIGLFSLYLLVTGAFRAVSVYVDDARGDPILTVVDGAIYRWRGRREIARSIEARHQLEGEEVADRAMSGAAAGLPDTEIVIVTSRRKSEWVEGAFVITQEKWYRIGEPVERDTPNGLRTLYPLNEAGQMEVLRKGIRYDLP